MFLFIYVICSNFCTAAATMFVRFGHEKDHVWKARLTHFFWLLMHPIKQRHHSVYYTHLPKGLCFRMRFRCVHFRALQLISPRTASARRRPTIGRTLTRSDGSSRKTLHCTFNMISTTMQMSTSSHVYVTHSLVKGVS